MVSAMTGEWLEGLEAEATYWYDSLRAPVQFQRAVQVLAEAGHRTFIEVSPHPVLTAAITETLDEAVVGSPIAGSPAVTVTGTLRRADGGPSRFLSALAEVHVAGTGVDWTAVLDGGQRVELPTYAFQRRRYWPRTRPALAALGIGAVGHPLLGEKIELAAGEGVVFTGILSVPAQPWLADHAVAGAVLLPGTAFLEMAVRAADASGCGQVEELTLEAPLALTADGAVQVQLTVGGPDDNGRRALQVHSRAADARAADASAEGAWTRHATGLLGPAAPRGADLAEEFAVWPPLDAEEVDIAGLYDGLAQGGYGYGPAFRGLRAAWQRGNDMFADVALPADTAADAGGFRLHPALLDAAWHAASLDGGAVSGSSGGTVRLPWAWTGVSLFATGAAALRVRLRPDGAGGLSLAAADSAGTPVLSAESLVLRPVDAARLGGNAAQARRPAVDSLFAVGLGAQVAGGGARDARRPVRQWLVITWPT